MSKVPLNTDAEKEASETALWIRMVQVVAKVGYILPAEGDREIVRVTVSERRVKNKQGRFATHRVGVAPNGRVFEIPMQIFHEPEDAMVYDGVAFKDPNEGDDIVFFFSAAGADVFGEYNRTHPKGHLLGDNREPYWRIVENKLRIVIDDPQLTSLGKRMRAGTPRGCRKSAILSESCSRDFSGPSVFEVEGESRFSVYVTRLGPWREGMILNPKSTGSGVTVRAARVADVPLSEELLGIPITSIDPDSIIAFGRRWTSGDAGKYRKAANAAGAAVPDEEMAAKSQAILWWTERGQVALIAALHELDEQLWDTISTIHTQTECKEVLGLKPEATAEDAIAKIELLRKETKPEDKDPVLTWMVQCGVKWACNKAPIAISARKRVLGRVMVALRRPLAMIEYSAPDKSKVQIDAWGFLRPNGNTEKIVNEMVELAKKEADGTEASGGDRIEYLNKALAAANVPILDITKAADKGRYLSHLAKAAAAIKVAIATPPSTEGAPPAEKQV